MEKERMSGSPERQRNRTHTASETTSHTAKHAEEMGKPITLKTLLGYIFTLLVFMVLCALVFSALEGANELHQIQYWKSVKQDIANEYNLSDSELLQLVARLDGLKKYGLSPRRNWEFYSSFWFTMTITTTIGFGHITPATTGGRLFCIFCGLLGIPLNALVLKHVGDKIRIWTTNGIRTFEIRYLGHLECRNAGVKCACITFVLMIIVILLGGCLDLIFDGWTLANGIYFNFVALSTVGFGDIYPSVNNPSKLDDLGLSETGKRVLASGIMLVYLTLGLAIVSSVVMSILNAIEEVEKAKHRLVSWRRQRQRETTIANET